ncbi:unnamed protein product (macronuclear) [Paramecium tetraurelia]|uniref:MORN repeat protein n=1 Tax=Paramecium tetraurelia TaxID=5888 RepID=A0DQR5_PARTE|nr:uncharacterized protein GSPATT00002782001 [Paramecium tetraurelia]CAK85382.1 unnamed protein product [Paramecium tetraurelia]|eukprot:XP_001452779.1 hypothetical protein (macronuclear) [Paramecium tetraurelia strain d4-2]
MYYPQPYYPQAYPQYRYQPYGVRPQVPQQWRPPVYNAPQYPYPGLRIPPPTYPYNPYNPYTSSIVPPTYQPQPMLSQIMASPQRQFQSPDRLKGAQSPNRNMLMQSQQVPKSPAPQLQSPNRQYLTYEQVQERIRKQQPQSPQYHKQYTPQPKPSQQKQQPEASKQKQQPTQPPKKEDDLDKRYQNALKSTEEIIKKYNIDDSGSKGRQTNQENQEAEAEDGEIQELALQYEDGFIYRGQGYPPQTRSGFGILTDSDGQQIYAGYWKDNLYDGQGRLTNLQTEELTEPIDWNNMTTIGNGWASYEGNFYQGKMHGQGTLILTNNEQYFGEFEDGMVHGDGEFTNLDGQVIKGKWDQGYLIQLSEQE